MELGVFGFEKGLRHHSFVTSEPGVLQAMKSIYLKTPKIQIEGSNVLAGKSLFINDEAFNDNNSGMVFTPKITILFYIPGAHFKAEGMLISGK
jgi:hypothetical protein